MAAGEDADAGLKSGSESAGTAGASGTDFHVVPWTAVIDTNEGAPYDFRGFQCTVKGKKVPIIVRTVQKPLYAMGKKTYTVGKREITRGLADYSIDGMEDRIQIERKSLSDLYSTLGDDWDYFEAELMRLNECEYAAVMVEAGWGAIARGVETSQMNPASVTGAIMAWSVRYPRVHWWYPQTRDWAERVTFTLLNNFWKGLAEQGL